MSVAWFCPGCNKYHAPHVETCPVEMSDPWGLRYLPKFTPYHPESTHDPCANCAGACGNVACPKRSIVTSTYAYQNAPISTAGGVQ